MLNLIQIMMYGDPDEDITAHGHYQQQHSQHHPARRSLFSNFDDLEQRDRRIMLSANNKHRKSIM